MVSEAKVLQELAGAGGAPLLVGMTDECPEALVMELIEGVTIAHYLPMVTPEEREVVYNGVRRAVQEVHEAGFFHRDLHEGNILIDNDGHVRIIDFGRAIKFKDFPTLRVTESIESYINDWHKLYDKE